MSLFTTIAEFKLYIPVDANLKFATMKPHIDEAEKHYLVEILGKAFYLEFKSKYENSKLAVEHEDYEVLSEDNLVLLPYIQRALAYYAQVIAIPHLTSTFGDMGVRQHRAEDSDPAPRWMIEKLQFNALRNADINADILIEFLEDNLDVVDYNTWATSSANTKNNGFIVRSTTVASRHIDINNSRRVFLKLRTKIREIERKGIPKLISAEQYSELLEQLQDEDEDAVTEANAALIEKLEPIICKRALHMQLPFMRVQINDNGIFIYSGTDDIFKLGQLATDADIKILREQLKDDKELGYLADENELRQFILDNINDYPLIKASTAYTVQPDPGPTWTPLNDPCGKHFGV